MQELFRSQRNIYLSGWASRPDVLDLEIEQPVKGKCAKTCVPRKKELSLHKHFNVFSLFNEALFFLRLFYSYLEMSCCPMRMLSHFYPTFFISPRTLPPKNMNVPRREWVTKNINRGKTFFHYLSSQFLFPSFVGIDAKFRGDFIFSARSLNTLHLRVVLCHNLTILDSGNMKI